MRISKEKAAENRAALIRAASKLFRERGIDGVGVAEISKEAGLTHGALYAHFRSKEELALEALSYGLDQSASRMYSSTINGMPDLGSYLDDYLTADALHDYASRCPMSASASEIGRQDKAISARFAEGYMVMVRAFERQIADNEPGSDALARAMVVVATMIGSIAVARGAAKGNPQVAEQVLKAARTMIDELMLAQPHPPAAPGHEAGRAPRPS
ncbi:TetR/AcrR family transcriptional regulator [Massilia sp. TN1-12]|uniref:TetR/AcrR family transcriptional regulator n=1 Tax=Massilia paldalensis TaxID=3377675 RepID=UPI00384AB958